ncbi:MAG: polysaccharide deacetylase family protein [Hyphomicrobiaceae bacterium]|jgi:peptidoglycan/xylan/chitin deacetylase (PgdA/CDA1 family)
MRLLARLTTALTAALLLAAPAAACPKPGTLGTTRTVEIDTTGGPGFGFEQYKVHDFLMPKEVVLTFDDGPWPSTRAVLEALEAQCVKATFFTIGKHALYHPDILKDVATRGHTIGTHTWSHADLAKLPPDKARAEIEKGLSAVKLSLGAAPAPFFRFPFLKDPQEQVSYLGTRNLAIFSHDLDSFDFKIRSADGVVKSVMQKLEKKGKGIILMHDFQASTAKALPALLDELKAGGYKVVHMKAKGSATTLAEFDEAAKAETKGVVVGPDRPTSSIVKTIQSQ